MEKTLNEKDKDYNSEYVNGWNDAFNDILREDNRSDAYEAGYSGAKDQMKLEAFRDWYTEYRKKN